jgi:hypothetical protein
MRCTPLSAQFERVGTGDGKRPGGCLLGSAELKQCQIDLVLQPFASGQHLLTGDGQAHGAGVTVKQGLPQVLLQLLDVQAERRLAHTELLRSGRERLSSSDFGEREQGGQKLSIVRHFEQCITERRLVQFAPRRIVFVDPHTSGKALTKFGCEPAVLPAQ